jgi:hypothetical protein
VKAARREFGKESVDCVVEVVGEGEMGKRILGGVVKEIEVMGRGLVLTVVGTGEGKESELEKNLVSLAFEWKGTYPSTT